MRHILAALVTCVLIGGALAPEADARRVRTHSSSESDPDPIKLDIPDQPAIDYKGLLNADALTVAISKTSLLPKAQAGAKPLVNLLKGTHLKKLGEEGGYYRVETADKKQGYVIRYAVARGKIDLKPTTADTLGVIKANVATTLYAFPGKAAPVVGKLAAGQKVPHLFSIGAFYKVKTPQGKIAYMEKASGTASAK